MTEPEVPALRNIVDDAMATSDARLIAGLRAGHAASREAFVRRYAGYLLAVARRMINDHGLAEDCVQDALIAALDKIDGFEQRSSLRSWLHRILVNVVLMRLRAQKRRPTESLDALMPEFDANACRIEQPWGRIATPDEVFERESAGALVRLKIGELPETHRVILIMRDIEEMDTASVAYALGISESATKVRLHRARSALKKLLEPVLRSEWQ